MPTVHLGACSLGGNAALRETPPPYLGLLLGKEGPGLK